MARWMHELRAGRRLARSEQDEKRERRGRVDLFFPSCDPVFWSTDWSIGPWWPGVDMGQAVCACVPGLLLYVDIGFRLGPIYNYKLCLCWAAGPGSSNFFTGVQRGEKMLGTSASSWIHRGRLTPTPTRSFATGYRHRISPSPQMCMLH